jgi:hypothetical protein
VIGAENKFSAQQAAEIIAPLLAARRQEPPLLQAYALLTQVLVRCEIPPTAEQLILLHEGARNFRQVSELMLRAIYFHVAGGQPAAAASLVDLALAHASEPEVRARLERMRVDIAAMLK